MAPLQHLTSDCKISDWLNRVQPGCAAGIIAAFNEVGVECFQDLFSIDEEVYKALEIELRSVGAQTAQISKVKKAIQMTLATCRSRSPPTALPSLPEDMTMSHCSPGDTLHPHMNPVHHAELPHLLERSPGLAPMLISMARETETLQHVTNNTEVHQTASEKTAGSCKQILGHVWQLSQDKKGCREVQDLLESSSEEIRQVVAVELRGRVFEAAMCPNANHVLRKCITILKTPALEFIVEEIVSEGPSRILEIARHRFGCRILEGLLIHCRAAQISDIIECLLAETVGLCLHMFGNYVIQALFEQGTESHRRHLLTALISNISTLGKNFYGCAVLANALHHGSLEDQLELADAFVANPGLLVAIMRFKRGPSLVQLVLNVLREQEREVAYSQLEAHGIPIRLSETKRVVQ